MTARTRPVPPAPAHARIPVELPDRFASAGDLTSRRALVTGGGRGLGLAIACALAEAGATVAVAGRHREYLDAAVETIGKRRAGAIAVEADVSDATSAAAAVGEAAERLGGLDLLVNNAGVAVRGAPEDLSADELDGIFATNLRGPYFASRAALRWLSGTGAVLNVASVAAFVPDVELTAYSASKAALVQLTRALAAAWGPRGVRVNAVAPGYTDSPLNAHRKADARAAHAVVGRTPLGRWGTPADVAQAVVFLASDAAAFVTGQTLVVDGGFSLTR